MLKLLYQSLRALASSAYDNRLVRAVFELKALAVNGEAPNVFSCLSCDSREHLTWFSVKRGGILCAECRNEAPDAVELNESTVYTMQYVILARIEKLYTFSVSGQVLEELTRLLRSYFGVYVGHAFKSLKILEDAEKVEIMFLK